MSEFDTPKSVAPWALILVVLIGGAFYLIGKNMETSDRTPTTITVSGEGKASGTPDIAELSFGVQTGRRASAKEAMAVLKREMNSVIEATKKAGIEDKDINTEQFSLNPAYDWTSGQQILRGYEATQSLRVKVRNLDSVSDVLAAATGAGANQAGSVSFGIDNPESVRAQAREKAITQAESKAKTLAAELGMSLGKIKGFSEGSNGYTPPYPMASMKAMDSNAVGGGGEAPAIPVGDQEVQLQVSITYELR